MRESKGRILMACRGVDARRLLRSASDMGLESAVLVGDSDDGALWPADFEYTMFVLSATPTASDVVGLALDAGCDFIHPGWGPLCRQSELAGRAQAVGLTLVGPTLNHLQLAADGSQVRDLAADLDISVVPGSEPIDELVDAERWLSLVGYPASARLLDDIDGTWVPLPDAESASPILIAMLEEGQIILERDVQAAREIEVLVVSQPNGESLTLGERDTSARIGGRRALVEAPAVNLEDEEAFGFRQAAATLISRLRWPGLVSVRFLLTPDGRAYLLRIRPGLQPWHAVSEETLGIDLVEAQIRIAMGDGLGWQPHHFEEKGHSFCLRLFATGTEPGRILRLSLPQDVRQLRGFEQGDQVAPGEEIAQLIAHAPTRQAAFVRARAALDQVVIDGIESNLRELKAAFDSKELWAGPLDRDRFDG
jgi:acetyl/propionyl-CoA carboxylase alpha subunit